MCWWALSDNVEFNTIFVGVVMELWSEDFGKVVEKI